MDFKVNCYYKNNYSGAYFKVIEYLAKNIFVMKYSKPHNTCEGNDDSFCRKANKKYGCQFKNRCYCVGWLEVAGDEFTKISAIEGKLRVGE